MDQAINATAVKVNASIDSTKSKITNKMKEDTAQMDKKADEMKEDAKS
jgi:uncharacterized membrane-anchored protein YjiN (DUF445 family)